MLTCVFRYTLQQLVNTSEQALAETVQSFELQKHQLRAQREQYEVSMDEKLANAASERKVLTENARGDFEVAVTKAKGEIEVCAII